MGGRETYMLVMTVGERYIGRIEGEINTGTGEIEVRINTPGTKEGRQGVDRMVEIMKKMLTRKTKRKVLENLHIAAGYGLCLMESGLVDRESIEELTAAAAEIADDMIERIKKRKKEGREGAGR